MIGLDPSLATPGSDPGPVTRFDDLQAGHSFVLRDQIVTRSVSEVADVVSLLDSAEEQARAGLWVAVVLTYEAGAAFDVAFPRRPLAPGLPLAWTAAFRSREHVPPLTPALSSAVVDVRRRPCGSVTGAPKVAAMRFIDQIKPWPRGLYCGAIGVIEPNGASDRRRPSATFKVAIRTAVIDKSSSVVEFGAGGGVTWGSQPDLEDAELESKAVVLTTCRPDFRLLETLRIHDSQARNLDADLGRMASSAAYFGFKCDPDEVRRACVAAAARTSGADVHWMRILLSKVGHIEIELDRLEPVPAGPVRLALAPLSVRSDDVFCCHKTTNRSIYERVAVERPDADDVLLGNERGEITETCRANLLVRVRDRWFTPPLASGGLAGIGRQCSMDRGDVSERVLLVDDLGEVDEFAVVSSLRGRRCATVHI